MRLRISAEGRASVRRFLFEIATITCGILIALGFDGLARDFQERREAREAAVNLQDEIRANQAEIERFLGRRLGEAREHITTAIGMADAELALRDEGCRGDPATEPRFELSMPMVSLGQSAYATAQATGALGHMPHPQVRSYARLYGYQAQFIQQHAQLTDQYVRMLPTDRLKLAQKKVADIERWRERLLSASQYLYHVESLARSLASLYRAHLGG